MVVSSTTDGFRAEIRALWSLEGTESLRFHTFTLRENRCGRLVLKNLGKGMPENVVWEELESLDIRVQGLMQLRSGRREQDPAKDLPPNSLFIITVPQWLKLSRMQSLTILCYLRLSVETYLAPKDPLHSKPCQRFGHTQRNSGYAT
jgi:hypothetical protein